MRGMHRDVHRGGGHLLVCHDRTRNGVFFGKGVKKGHKIAAPVVRYDTAPTIAYILGLQTPSVWRGRAITSSSSRQKERKI